METTNQTKMKIKMTVKNKTSRTSKRDRVAETEQVPSSANVVVFEARNSEVEVDRPGVLDSSSAADSRISMVVFAYLDDSCSSITQARVHRGAEPKVVPVEVCSIRNNARVLANVKRWK